MNSIQSLSLLAAATLALGATTAVAKDKPVNVTDCPAPVQEVIKKYQAQGTLEGVARDDKKKSGGPAVYEAKFELADGRRVEVHISAAGEVMQIEEKKTKTDKDAKAE